MRPTGWLAGRRAAPLALALALGLGCATPLDKARGAASRREYTEAEALFRKAMGDSKLAANARQELATMHATRAKDSANPDEAEALYKRALELEPAHDKALTGLVRLLRRASRLEDAQAVLDDASAKGECAPCQRLRVVVLLELGDRELGKKNWDAALTHYTAAQQVRQQPGAAVAIANAHAGAGRYREAAAALLAAKKMMAEADESVLASFLEIRRYVVDKALQGGDVSLADNAVGVGLANEEVQGRVSLALLVADHVLDAGKTKAALKRYEALLKAGNLGDLEVEVRTRAAKIYANRATAHLHAADGAAADVALSKAIDLNPDDWVLKLQRILAISGRSGAKPALASLAKVPEDTVGLGHTKAILWSLRVKEQLAAGDIAAARTSLESAKKAHPDLPEVHLATARVLANTEVPDLTKAERKLLASKKSLVRYGGEVMRYGEALSELDFVKTDLASRKKTTLFTAPWLSQATKDLERKLLLVYPYKVKFREESEPLVVLFNEAEGFLNITLRGPGEFADDLSLAPSDLHEVHLPGPGLVRLRIGRQKRIFFAEPFIHVQLSVP